MMLMLHIRRSICLFLTNVLSTSFLMFHIILDEISTTLYNSINAFCPLIKNPPLPPPVLNGQNQGGWNTSQNQMKITHPFCIVFEVLKVLLTIICKM